MGVASSGIVKAWPVNEATLLIFSSLFLPLVIILSVKVLVERVKMDVPR